MFDRVERIGRACIEERLEGYWGGLCSMGRGGSGGRVLSLASRAGHVREGVTDGVKVALEIQATVAVWERDRDLHLQ